jgi:hypothetical protein
VADDDDSPRNLLFGDGVVDDRVENGEARVERGLGERDSRKQ